MARKSAADIRAEVEAELTAKHEEITRRSEERAMQMFSSFVAEFTAKMGDARAAAGPAAVISDGASDRSLAQEMAHAMMMASATPERRATLVSPEERKAREEAREALVGLIIDNHAKGIVPAYKVTRKTFLAEMLVEPEYIHPTTKTRLSREVNWRGIPNQAMAVIIRPARDAADEQAIKAGAAVYALYQRSIGRVVLNANHASAWVTSGKELLRASPETEAASQPNFAPGLDPAKMSQMDGMQTVRLLGKTADPAVVAP